jgi:hypothetical protein
MQVLPIWPVDFVQPYRKSKKVAVELSEGHQNLPGVNFANLGYDFEKKLHKNCQNSFATPLGDKINFWGQTWPMGLNVVPSV